MKPKTNDVIFNQMAIDQAVILNKLTNVEADVSNINTKLNAEYATKEWCRAEYDQPKKMINGIAAIILTAVIVALVGLVVMK